jgi:26S proteasome regulatory subunit N7
MMASAFGVSAAFLDGELSEFIAAGRLNCKIDKARAARSGLHREAFDAPYRPCAQVAGVLETNRPDVKSALYQSVIKQGDALLNRIQRLGRVVE